MALTERRMRLIAYTFDFLQENHFVFKFFPVDGQFSGLNSFFFSGLVLLLDWITRVM